jgi:hypothetical protein
MDSKLANKLLGLVDSRSQKGIMARGKNRYNGAGTSPNPLGFNGQSAAKLMLARKKKQNGSSFTL